MKPSLPGAPRASTVFDEALRRLLNDEALASFTDWFSAAMLAAVQSEHPVGPAEVDDALRYQRHMARQLWGYVPVPSNRWRARGLPKVERNDRCPCGSGHKYKQCCAALDQSPMPLPPDGLLMLALEAAEPQMLTREKTRQISATALGTTALQWNDNGQPDKTVSVLGPLFTDMKGLDGRHEIALDALVDAMQQLGQDRARRQLLDQVAQHPDKTLATAARCRLVSVLADQGELERAWQLFHETTRFNPNDPQLWPLELTLLLTQGRQEEARLRAPLLAARARQAGMNSLADSLVQMAQGGMESVYNAMGDQVDNPDELAWLALVNTTPEAPDTEALQSMYRVHRSDVEENGKVVTAVSISPVKALADLNQRWRRRFRVGKPDMIWLEGDVDGLLEDLAAAQTFLQKHPAAWLSAEVLDDLLLVAHELCDGDQPTPVLKAAQRLADHALAVLRALVGQAQFHWIDANNRPMLRCLAVAVELARTARDDARAVDLLRWGLALNPHDNHGWRGQLAPLLIDKGFFQEALNLMAHYPQDMPPSEHLRALALFGLGQKKEAEAVLHAAHQSHPLYLNTLLPETLDAPPDEPGPGLRVGGAMAAWYHRLEWRPLWVRSGALAWVRLLNLPEPAPLKAPKARKAAAPRKAGASGPLGTKGLFKPFGAKEEKRLQKTCSNYPRLHGLLQSVAWSPQLLMPNAWLPMAMGLHDRMPNSRTEATATKALNDALGATMQLYNHLNQQTMDHQGDNKPPLHELIAVVGLSDAAVFAWTAGFVQGCERSPAAWARAGHKVTGQTGPFGRLRALAARASAQEGQERVLQDDGRPLLLALEEDPPAQQLLFTSLAELWPVVVASRRAGGG